MAQRFKFIETEIARITNASLFVLSTIESCSTFYAESTWRCLCRSLFISFRKGHFLAGG